MGTTPTASRWTYEFRAAPIASLDASAVGLAGDGADAPPVGGPSGSSGGRRVVPAAWRTVIRIDPRDEIFAQQFFRRDCHGNWQSSRGSAADSSPHAVVATAHVASALALKTRSVRRAIRWRWTLKMLQTAEHGQKALCQACRLESLHLPLSSSHRPVRVLRSVVQA